MTACLTEQAKAFSNRIVIVGYGTIGQCCLPMLLGELGFAHDRYTVIDGEERAFAYRGTAIRYVVQHLEPDSLDEALRAYLQPGDILVNVSISVDSVEVADWCQRHDVLYVDSSIEPWVDDAWDESLPPAARTEYAYHQAARNHAAANWRRKGPTAVFSHGANPGLVNHFVKAALLDVAAAVSMDVRTPGCREEWARLAQATQTRVIHISERDTQISTQPKRAGEFVNTWSIPGFVEEASMPVEIGWGTHEKTLPPGASHHASGPRNAIYVPRAAAACQLRSWVPLGGPILGLALPHSEAITLSEYLTVREGDVVRYRPTVAFAYLPCDAALASLHEAMMRDWRLQRDWRVLNEDIADGRDELGVLLFGHELGGWWYGSQLDVHEARKLVPGNNPTAIQVAAGVVAAACWAMVNPKEGYCEVEELPHDRVLEVATPYLGPMVSRSTDWTPLKHRRPLFDEPWLDHDDPWQFGNFFVG
ncbi:MAG: saccharopine dehydrogenase C-terminal domain-containing protein [Gammaproteobacteria bacterium]